MEKDRDTMARLGDLLCVHFPSSLQDDPDTVSYLSQSLVDLEVEDGVSCTQNPEALYNDILDILGPYFEHEGDDYAGYELGTSIVDAEGGEEEGGNAWKEKMIDVLDKITAVLLDDKGLSSSQQTETIAKEETDVAANKTSAVIIGETASKWGEDNLGLHNDDNLTPGGSSRKERLAHVPLENLKSGKAAKKAAAEKSTKKDLQRPENETEIVTAREKTMDSTKDKDTKAKLTEYKAELQTTIKETLWLGLTNKEKKQIKARVGGGRTYFTDCIDVPNLRFDLQNLKSEYLYIASYITSM